MILDWKNCVKMTIPHKVTYRFIATPIDLPMAFLKDLELKILKSIWKNKDCIVKQSWERKTWLEELGSLNSDYTKKLQYSKTYGMAQRQIYRAMEQDIKLRNKLPHVWSVNLWKSRKEYTMEKRQSLQ